jgi:hypothetical protein
MNDDINPLFFPMGDKRHPKIIKSPCSLDCDTDAGLFTLLIDCENPSFLFVSIDNELRKCVDLSLKKRRFETKEEAIEFLLKLRDSPVFDELVNEELNMNDEWDKL